MIETVAVAIGKVIGAVIVGFVGIIISGIVSALTGRRVTAPRPNYQANSHSRANTTNSEWSHLLYVCDIIIVSRVHEVYGSLLLPLYNIIIACHSFVELSHQCYSNSLFTSLLYTS